MKSDSKFIDDIVFKLITLLLLTLLIPSLLLTPETSLTFSFNVISVSPFASFAVIAIDWLLVGSFSQLILLLVEAIGPHTATDDVVAVLTSSMMSSLLFALFITRWLSLELDPDLVIAEDVMEWNVWLLVAENRIQFVGRFESAAANWNKLLMDYNNVFHR